MQNENIKIGLFGFGCVGQGLYHVLNNSAVFKAEIVKICVKDKSKSRSLDASNFTYDKFEILNNSEIDAVIELIDDHEEAFKIVSAALKLGKNVVTANKKMLAYYNHELFDLQKQTGKSLLYEASVCGSIPIIRSLEEYFDNEPLTKVSGIFNGTTNFILTKVFEENKAYSEVLAEAQKLGFAESDPTNDVEGFDPKFKSVILALHAFGVLVDHREVFNYGITRLNNGDIKYAKEKGYKIKLVPQIAVKEDKISITVLPQFVNSESELYNVSNENNAAIINGAFSGKQTFIGKGAGGNPTGAAVLSDISALSHGYKYAFKKIESGKKIVFTNDVILDVYLSSESKDFKAIVDTLKFDSVFETYIGKGYSYAGGKINLQNIIKHQDLLRKNKLFIAVLSDSEVTFKTTPVKVRVAEEVA